MSTGFLNTNITYKGFADKGLTLQVLDENGKKWVLWKNKQSGEESAAYLSFQSMKLGETFGISYKEQEKSFVGKDGKNITYTERTIFSIMPVIHEPIAKPSPKTPPQPKYESLQEDKTDKQDTFWEMKAYKQCLWNYFLEVKKGQPLLQADSDLVWNEFQNIAKDARKRFGEESPEDLSEKIPF